MALSTNAVFPINGLPPIIQSSPGYQPPVNASNVSMPDFIVTYSLFNMLLFTYSMASPRIMVSLLFRIIVIKKMFLYIQGLTLHCHNSDIVCANDFREF